MRWASLIPKCIWFEIIPASPAAIWPLMDLFHVKKVARAACTRDICSRSENSANLLRACEEFIFQLQCVPSRLFHRAPPYSPLRPWHLVDVESDFPERVTNHSEKNRFFLLTLIFGEQNRTDCPETKTTSSLFVAAQH